MGRNLVLLCVYCALYIVTYGEETGDTFIFPDEFDIIRRTTERPRPTGLIDTIRPNISGSNANRTDVRNQSETLSLDDLIKEVFNNETKKPSASTSAPTPQSLTESINVCGLSGRSLVQGGEAVQDTEFPWLGGVFGRARNMYLCTVNLVSAKHAVTAAHCFASTNADDFGIRWGHPRTSQSEVYTNLSSITVHPGYNTTSHDVAVVELSNSVTFSVSFKPICLWRTTWSADKGIIGTVASFGPNYEDLKKIEIPIVKQETCRASHTDFHHITSEFTFCAGTRNPKAGPCKGDSGAGFMQSIKNRYYLRGVVSHSLAANGTCNLQEYIIFADLSKEVDWIVEKVFNGATWKPSASTSARPATTPQLLTESINFCGTYSLLPGQGGDAVKIPEFPWLGGLYGPARNLFICNVNLVSAKHAVTAAPCFKSTNAIDYRVRWGHQRTSQSEVYTNLSSIIVHPGYNKKDFSHNVAIVVLSNSVTFTFSLKPICLWKTTWSPDVGITGRVASFGPYYQYLKIFEMPIVSQESCRARHFTFHFLTSEFTFCARTYNHEPGPCTGDSGAGYMQWVKDRYYLRGLVSHLVLINDYCDPRDYIIFADLSKEIDWLLEMIS